MRYDIHTVSKIITEDPNLINHKILREAERARPGVNVDEEGDGESLDNRINRHGGMEPFLHNVVKRTGESFQARQQLMALAQQLNNPDVTAGLEEAMGANPTRLTIWANAIKTPQDLQAKYEDWLQRGIVSKPRSASGGRQYIGIQNPYAFYRSLTPDQQGDLKGVAFNAYMKGGRIMPPQWAHPNDAPVLIQLYELIGQKMQQGGSLNM
jgi:hypothetical protein